MKKNLLKTLSLVLTICLSLSTVGCQKKDGNAKNNKEIKTNESGMSFEANQKDNNETFKPADYCLQPKDEYTYEFLGLKFKLNDKILEGMKNKDIGMLDDQSPIDQDLKYAMLTFSSLTEEQKNAEINKMGEGYVEWQNGLERIGTLGMFKKGTSEDEISKITKCDTHKNLGTSSDGEFEYYLSTNKASKFAEELDKTEVNIIDKKARPENGFVLAEKTDLENTVPFGGEGVTDLSNIVTKDIEGKEFSKADFEKYDLTMVNVFATWCTACVKEIPDLVKLQEEMKSKGVNIVGIVTDTVDDNGENKDAIEKSKLIHEKTKANYPFLMPDKTNFNGRLNGIQALPETFFVDKNGKIVGETYSGSHNFNDWKEIVEKELANLNK
ncbi:TlpA disulfide reductase family protein [Peptoniphilus sp. BV3AC2]|uniref:TlpA family protein disulfide reductase n=1 Tax=Peptoniphilus sp. BV3AC2 TaxID=1111133 RepID=UPI0003B921FF|nr:TlpA disulfide reductase family protein [Peptoniphilus sp. BV3AC2]ERT65021.1 glutathione peroxidase [Peptoniphilus sp. BV3AC2]